MEILNVHGLEKLNIVNIINSSQLAEAEWPTEHSTTSLTMCTRAGEHVSFYSTHQHIPNIVPTDWTDTCLINKPIILDEPEWTLASNRVLDIRKDIGLNEF